MTAQGILGEVLSEGRRLCTPSSAQWLDGDAIDAGTAMILDSNLSQQARESLHHLGTALGPGLLANQTQTDEFANVTDQDAPTNSPSSVQQVGWTQARSMCFGPFDLTQDQRQNDGVSTRNVVVSVDCDANTTTSLVLFVAITQGMAIPTDPTVLGFRRFVVPTASRATQDIEVGVQPVAPIVRRGAQSPTEPTAYLDAYVWLAWRATSGSNYLYAASIFEVR